MWNLTRPYIGQAWFRGLKLQKIQIRQAWFKELPEEESMSSFPEQVFQCNSEGKSLELVTMALDFAIELLTCCIAGIFMVFYAWFTN